MHQANLAKNVGAATVVCHHKCVRACVCVWYGLRRERRERVVGNEV